MNVSPRLSFLGSIPAGRAGTVATLKMMRAYVRGGKLHPLIQATALKLTRNLKQKDNFGEVLALYDFVRNKIRYVRDTFGVETLRTPDATLQIGQGDCDDKSVLLASLLGAIGYKTRFVALAFSGSRFSHVTVEVQPIRDGEWVNLETTEPVDAGWRPKGATDAVAVNN